MVQRKTLPNHSPWPAKRPQLDRQTPVEQFQNRLSTVHHNGGRHQAMPQDAAADTHLLHIGE